MCVECHLLTGPDKRKGWCLANLWHFIMLWISLFKILAEYRWIHYYTLVNNFLTRTLPPCSPSLGTSALCMHMHTKLVCPCCVDCMHCGILLGCWEYIILWDFACSIELKYMPLYVFLSHILYYLLLDQCFIIITVTAGTKGYVIKAKRRVSLIYIFGKFGSILCQEFM